MKRTLFWGIVGAGLVLLVMTTSAGQTTPTMHTEVGPSPSLENLSVPELEARGDVLRARLAYADALTCYRTALRKDRKNAMLYNKAGVAELQMKEMVGAQKDFERAIKYNRNLADAYNNLGVVFYVNRQYPESVTRYEKAIALDPKVAVYHSNLGAVLFTQNQMEKAVAEFSRAMDLDPEILLRPTRGAGTSARLATPEGRAHYFYIVAKLYGARGKVDDCLNCLEKAKEGNYPGIKDVYTDKDFEAVRQDPRLQQIMNKPQAD